jgi:hypothetical protein
MDIEDAMNMLMKLTQRLAQIFILCIPWVAVGNKMKDIVEDIWAVQVGMPTAFVLQGPILKVPFSRQKARKSNHSNSQAALATSTQQRWSQVLIDKPFAKVT